MPKFHPGDICIGQHLCEYSGHNGQECEVLEVIECGVVFVCLHTFGKVVIVGTCYLVRWSPCSCRWYRLQDCYSVRTDQPTLRTNAYLQNHE